MLASRMPAHRSPRSGGARAIPSPYAARPRHRPRRRRQAREEEAPRRRGDVKYDPEGIVAISEFQENVTKGNERWGRRGLRGRDRPLSQGDPACAEAGARAPPQRRTWRRAISTRRTPPSPRPSIRAYGRQGLLAVGARESSFASGHLRAPEEVGTRRRRVGRAYVDAANKMVDLTQA